MNITMTAEYGLLAVAYIAKTSKDSLVKTSSIAKEYNLPELFLTLAEMKYVVDRWRMDYNHYRPHSSLAYMTPAVLY